MSGRLVPDRFIKMGLSLVWVLDLVLIPHWVLDQYYCCTIIKVQRVLVLVPRSFSVRGCRWRRALFGRRTRWAAEKTFDLKLWRSPRTPLRRSNRTRARTRAERNTWQRGCSLLCCHGNGMKRGCSDQVFCSSSPCQLNSRRKCSFLTVAEVKSTCAGSLWENWLTVCSNLISFGLICYIMGSMSRGMCRSLSEPSQLTVPVLSCCGRISLDHSHAAVCVSCFAWVCPVTSVVCVDIRNRKNSDCIHVEPQQYETACNLLIRRCQFQP